MDCQSSALKQPWGQRRSETFSKCGIVASHHHAAVAIPSFARILSLTFGLSTVAMVPARRSLFPCVVVRGVFGGNGPSADAGLRCPDRRARPMPMLFWLGAGRGEGLAADADAAAGRFLLGGSAGGLVDQPDWHGKARTKSLLFISLFSIHSNLEARSKKLKRGHSVFGSWHVANPSDQRGVAPE